MLNFYRKFLLVVVKTTEIEKQCYYIRTCLGAAVEVVNDLLCDCKRNDKRPVRWIDGAFSAFDQCKCKLAGVAIFAYPAPDQ